MISFYIHLGLRDRLELDEMIQELYASEEDDQDTGISLGTYTYEDILNKTFKLVNQCLTAMNMTASIRVWKDKSPIMQEYMKKLVDRRRGY